MSIGAVLSLVSSLSGMMGGGGGGGGSSYTPPPPDEPADGPAWRFDDAAIDPFNVGQEAGSWDTVAENSDNVLASEMVEDARDALGAQDLTQDMGQDMDVASNSGVQDAFNANAQAELAQMGAQPTDMGMDLKVNWEGMDESIYGDKNAMTAGNQPVLGEVPAGETMQQRGGLLGQTNLMRDGAGMQQGVDDQAGRFGVNPHDLPAPNPNDLPAQNPHDLPASTTQGGQQQRRFGGASTGQTPAYSKYRMPQPPRRSFNPSGLLKAFAALAARPKRPQQINPYEEKRKLEEARAKRIGESIKKRYGTQSGMPAQYTAAGYTPGTPIYTPPTDRRYG